jgi:pimeloyl-ACP methyl ester carboxylesterase
VNIGSGSPGTGLNWFRSASSKTRYINTDSFEKNKSEKSATLVIVHGYGAAQGFSFWNFDALADHFKVIALG